MKDKLQLHVSALVELVILFSPAIPAYLWLWPNVSGAVANLVQVVVYFYFLAGCLIIGLRRWTPNQLGLNRKGLGLSLTCGGAFLLMSIVGRFATNLKWEPHPLTLERLAFDIVFYFGLVGLIEELLFRGLIYRAFYELRGDRLAIWGSALAFGVYHVGWQGTLGFATALIGLVFGAIRWRAGGILGLILIHGLYDIIAVEGWPNAGAQVGQLEVVDRTLAILGDVLLFGILVYLWKLHPIIAKAAHVHTRATVE